MRRKKQKRTKTRVVRKSKAKRKKKVLAVLAKPEFYNVELEVASKSSSGVTQYSYVSYPSGSGVTEEVANELADGMKVIGCGGRIVHQDGTPDGKVILVWGSVERAAAAEKAERTSLEK